MGKLQSLPSYGQPGTMITSKGSFLRARLNNRSGDGRNKEHPLNKKMDEMRSDSIGFKSYIFLLKTAKMMKCLENG